MFSLTAYFKNPSGASTHNSTVMIYVRVTVKNGLDIKLSEMLFHKCHSCFHIFLTHHDVKDYPAMICFNEGGICHIVTAHLVYTVAYFKKSRVSVELRVPPQAWIYRIRSFFILDKIEISKIPRDLAVIALNNESVR